MTEFMSKDDKLINKKWKQKYSLHVQELLELIPVATSVYKQDMTTEAEGVVFPAYKWVINDRVVDSDFRRVWSIEADDTEVSLFKLNKTDFKKVIKACEQRRAELIKQRQKTK